MGCENRPCKSHGISTTRTCKHRARSQGPREIGHARRMHKEQSTPEAKSQGPRTKSQGTRGKDQEPKTKTLPCMDPQPSISYIYMARYGIPIFKVPEFPMQFQISRPREFQLCGGLSNNSCFHEAHPPMVWMVKSLAQGLCPCARVWIGDKKAFKLHPQSPKMHVLVCSSNRGDVFLIRCSSKLTTTTQARAELCAFLRYPQVWANQLT